MGELERLERWSTIEGLSSRRTQKVLVSPPTLNTNIPNDDILFHSSRTGFLGEQNFSRIAPGRRHLEGKVNSPPLLSILESHWWLRQCRYCKSKSVQIRCHLTQELAGLNNTALRKMRNFRRLTQQVILHDLRRPSRRPALSSVNEIFACPCRGCRVLRRVRRCMEYLPVTTNQFIQYRLNG